MIKILANDGIDAAGKKIFDAAGFSVSTDKVPQEKLAEALKNFDAILVEVLLLYALMLLMHVQILK